VALQAVRPVGLDAVLLVDRCHSLSQKGIPVEALKAEVNKLISHSVSSDGKEVTMFLDAKTELDQRCFFPCGSPRCRHE
jgi:hypothetical protein